MKPIMNSDAVNWDQADGFFRRLSDGLLRSSNLMRPAVIWAFKRAPSRRLQRLSGKACLPFVEQIESRPTNRLVVTQPQVLLEAAICSLVKPSFNGVRFSVWHSMFNELYRVHRWVQRQSAQSRIQACFLTGFVPVIAVILGLSNFATFAGNLAQGRGQIVLFAAVVLY
ncbi:hypothetical protein EBR21_11555, partial [bacterium]|nr:hypothetical protein [bacterium]